MASTVARAVFDLRIERVRAALLRALGDVAAVGPPSPSLAALGRCKSPDAALARRFGLSPALVDFVWTALAIDVDPRLLASARRLVGADVAHGATVALHALAFNLGDDEARALVLALESGTAGRIGQIIAPSRTGELASATPWVVPRRVRAFLLGVDEVDPLVAGVGGPVAIDDDPLLDDAQRAAEDTVARVLEETGPLFVAIEGQSGVGRRAAVARAAGAVGRVAVELDFGRFDGRIAPLDAVVASWSRECILRDAIGVLANVQALGDSDRRRLLTLVDAMPSVVAVTAPPGGLDLGLSRPLVRVPYHRPDAATRHRLWSRAAGDSSSVDIDALAGRYPLGASAIDRSVQAARILAGDEPLTTSTVIAGVRATLAEKLGGLAELVTTTGRWDDLVLADDTLDALQLLVSRVRHGHRVLDVWGFGKSFARGRGLAALLSGPPGTGKTLAASVVARELELDLYQVDLSRVLSKWIGETEKQLAAIFDAAEAGNALLLFDEADSLFARRTEVKGANDRYANLEVNFLLTRIESFGGVTLLTTNLEASLDPAIRRRLAAHIPFWPPGPEEREQLWRRMVPEEAPRTGLLDFARLASHFPHMTGAHIRNAAVGAAFRAAAGGEGLSMAVLEHASRAEYAAMGRVLAGAPGR